MTLYINDVERVSKSWANKWTARGFEISGHPDDTNEAGNPVWAHMDSAILSKKNEIASQFGLPMRTVVNHWFVWCGRDRNGRQDFGAQARLEEKNGMNIGKRTSGNVNKIKRRVGHVDGIFITTAGDSLKQFSHPESFICHIPNMVEICLTMSYQACLIT